VTTLRARALAVGSDVAHHSTLEANTGAYGCASSMAKKKRRGTDAA
jgi:hypothetical protein